MLGRTRDFESDSAAQLDGGYADRPRADERAGPAQRRRIARPRILVVGCGDVGLRLVARLVGRYRIHALTHSPDRVDDLRTAGAMPIVADLDRRTSLNRLGGLAPVVVHLAPPPSHGLLDTRTRALCSALAGVRRMIYISTSGVYGDCSGALIDETRTASPTTARAIRRVDAERRLRAWAAANGVRLVILRVPGIYAAERLPIARLNSGTPVLQANEDVFTNHVHADDLARLIELTLHRGSPQRIYHAVDDSRMRMGDWFDLVADAHALPRPERVSRAEVERCIAPTLLSFMSESRQLSNRRMVDELGMRLTYPTVRDGLAAALGRKR